MERIANKITGHVVIRDVDTGEVLVDQHNDIHMENFSEALAKSLCNFSSGCIQEMHFGNGGSVITATGNINYSAPNISGIDADLYNTTYFKVVNDRNPTNVDKKKNKVEVSHIAGTYYTDIVVTCTLDYAEPSNQDIFDSGVSTGTYIFDELGLKTVDPELGVKRLLTHCIFSPTPKALNRAIEIIYTVRVALV